MNFKIIIGFIWTIVICYSSIGQTILFGYSANGNMVSKYTAGYDEIIRSQEDSTFGCLRYVIHCASDGDTIRYEEPFIDTSFMKAPLEINKSLYIANSLNTPVPWIYFDFELPGFNQASFGLKIPASRTITMSEVNFRQKNSSDQVPVIRNSGTLILDQIQINGLTDPYVKNEGNGEIRVVNGWSEIKKD